jgi:hypothetical protein
MLCLLLNLLIHPLEDEKLAVPRQAAMSKVFSWRWVPTVEMLPSCTCLNHATDADSSFSSGECFSYFHSLVKGPHWVYLHSISVMLFTVVFNMDTENLKCDANSAFVPICASPCSKIFILSLALNDFHFY